LKINELRGGAGPRHKSLKTNELQHPKNKQKTFDKSSSSGIFSLP
jgi:hypothetical protein